MDKKSQENRRSLKGIKVSSWLKCFVCKNTNFRHPVTVVFREERGKINEFSNVDQMHEEHKRVKKVQTNKVQRLLTKIWSFQNKNIVLFPTRVPTRKRVWAKGQGSLLLLPLLALLYNFSKSKVLNVH